MMDSVVAEGTGKNAGVKGYSIGGKTGTSEDGINTNKYITSFVGVADTKNPEVAILVILYNPTGEAGHQRRCCCSTCGRRNISRSIAILRSI